MNMEQYEIFAETMFWKYAFLVSSYANDEKEAKEVATSLLKKALNGGPISFSHGTSVEVEAMIRNINAFLKLMRTRYFPKKGWLKKEEIEKLKEIDDKDLKLISKMLFNKMLKLKGGLR